MRPKALNPTPVVAQRLQSCNTPALVDMVGILDRRGTPDAFIVWSALCAVHLWLAGRRSYPILQVGQIRVGRLTLVPSPTEQAQAAALEVGIVVRVLSNEPGGIRTTNTYQRTTGPTPLSNDTGEPLSVVGIDHLDTTGISARPESNHLVESAPPLQLRRQDRIHDHRHPASLYQCLRDGDEPAGPERGRRPATARRTAGKLAGIVEHCDWTSADADVIGGDEDWEE